MARRSKVATLDFGKLNDGELISLQQKTMADRAAAEKGFREQQQLIQFEIDKRAALARFGTLGPAELAAIAEIQQSASVAVEE
jgi:hypothetical protein